MKLSARNQIKGKVVEVRKGSTTAHVRIDIGNGVIITSSITNEAVDDLGLRVFVHEKPITSPVTKESSGAVRRADLDQALRRGWRVGFIMKLGAYIDKIAHVIYYRSHENFTRESANLARTAKNSGGTASAGPFFQSADRRQPRVSTEINIWLADNLLQRTAKTARSVV
jgi:molybdopterin-binding protein